MRRFHQSRRAFLAGCISALGASAGGISTQERRRPRARENRDQLIDRRIARMGDLLRPRFRDLHRHFILEYYPWYGTDPWTHWDEGGRTPPGEIAASSLPLLGAYDSRSTPVIERHARWIKESGAGSINLSWWGIGTYEDRATPIVMDVMRAFDIKVTFHLEPYSRERGIRFAEDVLYILREYGERRRFDSMLLLEDANGRTGPVFKTFVTLLSPTTTDCMGVTRPVDIFVPDDVWRQQLVRLRRDLASDFDTVTFVADSLDAARTRAVGFDAGAVGNPYIRPDEWRQFTLAFDRTGVPFSFAVNAGFDAVPPKQPPSDPCYRPLAFEPAVDVDWEVSRARERAHQLCDQRIMHSFERTLAHQTDPRSANWQRGFLLVPINSFNEWHEGTAFEPMKSHTDLTAAERRLYHNPVDGSYRLDTLKDLLGLVL